MTKISRRRKIACWESVKEKIQETLENVPEHTTALTLPYGMQGLYNISHAEPLRILLHPNMNDFDTFVTHHGKAKKFYLNLWTVNQKDSHPEKKNTKIKLDYKLKHLVYVPTHRCFVAFATDLTLRVYATINFMEMSRTETSHSVLCLFYNACRDDVLAGCLGFVMIWKFPHAQSDPMFPTQKIECPAIYPEYWVTWIRVDKPSRQLLMNCEDAIVILDERDYKLKYNFKIDFRHDLAFTSCAFYHPSCYFITGSKDYTIKVWNTSLNQCPLVTSFCGHCSMITALEVDIPHHLVISSSTDKTIRLWCLETFKQTYVLETGEEVHHMELMTSRRLFYQSHEHIRVWNLNHFHTLFTMLGFEIVTSRRVVSRGFPTRLLLHGKDGAIRIVSPSDGTIITTMFPLDTLPEGIVDYAYNPREDRLYVVLSSGAILVFSTRTNPCSTYQLWKADILDEERVTSTSLAESYGVNCVAMMNVDEISESGEEEVQHYSLLFAGLNNGHISLVYSNELSMHDTIEAHYGKIALLRVSEGLDKNNSLYSAILVSCGTDCELKVWKIVSRDYYAKIISLELWSYVKLLSIPQDMETIGCTIGLVMDNNTLMTCRVNPEAERPARSRHSSHRDSSSRNGLDDMECFTSISDESHSKVITGLSACPTLGLFATSSDDWSVKIWNTEAKLLKEICFEESLRGVCFANTRGDLLVGFQCHISIVPLTNYLPLQILEKLSTMDFPDDIFENHLPFDRMLAFSYDPLRTPCLPLDLGQRRLMLQEDEECKMFTHRMPSALLLLENYDDGDDPDGEETEPPPRRYSTAQEQGELDEKIRKFQRSSMSRRSSALQSPLLEEVIARITQSFSSRPAIAETNVEASSCDLVEQLRRLFHSDDCKIPDDYWPCAPDGFIPNSVVRDRVPPKEVPAHLIPRLLRGDEALDWMKRMNKKRSPKDGADMADDLCYPVSFDDDDDLGFFSIFDGYDEASHELEKKRVLIDSSDEDDEEAQLNSSDEEKDLKKKWKASTKTAMDKDQMLLNIRARQTVRDKKKVSKKPEMPMIMAAEEEDTDDVSKAEVAQDTQSLSEVPDAPILQLPPILHQVIEQPWFPKESLGDGVTVEDMFEEIIAVMSNCAPLTYARICEGLRDLMSIGGVAEDQKMKMKNVVVENLHHPSPGIRRASIRTVQDLQITSNQAVKGIVSCLIQGSNEMQQDALSALSHLLGVKDQEGMRDLFIKIDILSRTPTPDSDGASSPLHRLRTRSRQRTGFQEIDSIDGTVDKDKYINDWLAVDGKSIKAEKSPSRSESFKIESQQIKMASSIVSKIKLYKPQPRLSIVDLAFRESPESSRASFEAEEMTSSPVEDAEALLRKLQQTRAGCNLLLRLGHSSTLADNSQDPALDIDVPENNIKQVQRIDKKSKTEKRPPSALTGFAYRKAEKLVGYEQDERVKVDRGYGRDRTIPVMGQEQEMNGPPEIRVSRVSSASKRSELLQEIDKLVLPKIFNTIKAHRRNSTSSAVRRRNGRRFSVKRENCLRLPGFDDRFTERQARTTGYTEIKHQGDQLEEKPNETRINVAEKDFTRPRRRMTLVEDVAAIDGKRRKCILKELQRQRLENELLHISKGGLENVRRLLADRERSLSETTSLKVPTPSEDCLLSSDSDIHLPKIGIYSKQEDLKHQKITKTSRGVLSDDVTCDMISADITQVMPSSNVPHSPGYSGMVGESYPQGASAIARRPLGDPGINNETPYSPLCGDVVCEGPSVVVRRPLGDLGINNGAPFSPLFSDVAGERLSQGTSVIPRRPLGDEGMNNETMRVLPVNPKLTVDTGCYKWGKSRYGVLEVVWTSRGIYDTQGIEGSTVVCTHRRKTEVKKQDQQACVPTRHVAVKKLLKPITNRNLVTNPYARHAEHYFAKKRQRLPCISESVGSMSPSNSDSSRKPAETEHLCTVREVLEFDNYCFTRSS